MGARSRRLPSPPAACGILGEAHPGRPRAAARDSANRRYFLSETLDGRDAQRTPVRERRAHGAELSDATAVRLPGAAAADRPVGGRRSVPRQPLTGAYRASAF